LFSPRNHLFARVLLFAVGHVLWKGAADHEDAPKKTIYVPARKKRYVTDSDYMTDFDYVTDFDESVLCCNSYNMELYLL
jgi:hypothetical protein